MLTANSPDQDVAEDKLWKQRFLWCISGLFLLRLAYLLVYPLNLSGDEMYYWDWSRQLDWGYFSKPPLIAWLMHLATLGGGNLEFSIRATAVLLGTGSLAFIFALGRSLYNARTGFLAAAACALCPGNVLSTLLLTIDAPLIFCWSGALYAFWQVADRRKNHRTWGLLLVLFLGLGILTKQMMLTFIPLGLVYLYVNPETRPLLRKVSIWIGIAVALCFLLPTLWWNYQHQWITLEHTAGHFEARSIQPGKILGRILTLAGGQAMAISPITFILIVAVLTTATRNLSRLRQQERFLWLFSAPALLVIATLTLRQNINENWPAVFYLSAFVLTAGWVANQFTTCCLYPWRKAFRPGLWVGLGLVLLTYALPFIVPLAGLNGGKLDPTVRLRGWKTLGGAVSNLQRKPEWPKDAFIITAGHRYMTSAIAFYDPEHPRVYKWPTPGKTESQYDIWGGFETKIGQDAVIIVSGEEKNLPKDLPEAFEKWEEWKQFIIPLGQEREAQYRVYRGIGFRGVPEKSSALE